MNVRVVAAVFVKYQLSPLTGLVNVPPVGAVTQRDEALERLSVPLFVQ